MYSWKMKHALNRFEIGKSLTQYFEGFAESFLDSYKANSKLQSSVTLRSRPDTEYKRPLPLLFVLIMKLENVTKHQIDSPCIERYTKKIQC